MTVMTPQTPTPVPALQATAPYRTPRGPQPLDLFLDGNEGPAWSNSPGLRRSRRYPNQRPLQEKLAKRFGVDVERVFLSAGGDEALDRICRGYLAPDRVAVMHAPGFEMVGRYVRLTGAALREVPWKDGIFPADAFAEAVADANASVAFLTSPNNPTGQGIATDVLVKVARQRPQTLWVVDLAYVEFANEDPTAQLLQLPNVVIVRTMSKGWGLAGLRLGITFAAPSVVQVLKAAGSPYPVSQLSLDAAADALDDEAAMRRGVARVQGERASLTAQLTALGCNVLPSEANFIMVDSLATQEVRWLQDACAALGVGVRAFGGRAGLEDAVRISCPGDDALFARLSTTLQTALRPQAVLFDMDGVLANVSTSYRACIRETAAAFGVEVTEGDVVVAKAKGNANDDWALTQKLILAKGGTASLADVTSVFESLYQGGGEQPGLRMTESLLVDKPTLVALKAKLPLAVVTGRPRQDAQFFLERFGLADVFDVVVAREDAPKLKPDPAPVLQAMKLLGVERAWMLGDTPDDVRAAKAAGVVGVGAVPRDALDDDSAARLLAVGAARVWTAESAVELLLEVLP